jgi:hypothetical protein
LLGEGSPTTGKQIGAGNEANEKNEDVLDQVLLNEANEAKSSN